MATPEVDLQDALEKAPITAEPREVKPIHIFSPEGREVDENIVARLVKSLTRHGQLIHPILLLDQGASRYRLIAGRNRLEAWTRCYGEQLPIPAKVYPPDTPDALSEILEIEENLRRKELTAADRQVQTIRLFAAYKKLDNEKPATELPVSGSSAKSATSGGRGKKAATAKLAGELGLSKTAVQKRIKAAEAAIDEEIDPDRDTPEELERKADKRQQAERKVGRPKRRKPAPRVEDPTPAESHVEETGSKIEAARKAFDALARKDQLRFIHDACLHLGLNPLKMAPPAAFGLADAEPDLHAELRAEVAPAADDAAAEQAEHGGEAAVAQAKEEDEAALAKADQGNDGAESGAEDLQDASEHDSGVADEEPDLAEDLPAEVAPASNAAAEDSQTEHEHEPAVAQAQDEDDVTVAQASQGDDGAESGAEDLQDAGDDEADDPELGVTKCAYCKEPFLSGHPPRMKYGRLYHRMDCVNHAKPIAMAAD